MSIGQFPHAGLVGYAGGLDRVEMLVERIAQHGCESGGAAGGGLVGDDGLQMVRFRLADLQVDAADRLH